MTPIGHAGHWITDVAYFLPVLGFLAWLGATMWRDRRRRRVEEGRGSMQEGDVPPEKR